MTISGTRAVRSASIAEDRFADEPCRRPGRHDQAEEGEVDALLGEVDAAGPAATRRSRARR